MVRLGLNNLILGGGNMLRNSNPCTTSLTFWSSILDFTNNKLLNKLSPTGASLQNSNCLTFNGTDNFLAASSKYTWFDTTTNAWTIAFAIYYDNSVEIQRIVSNFLTSSLYGFSLTIITGGALRIVLSAGGSANRLLVDSVLTLNPNSFNKVHITYTGGKNPESVSIHINNVLSTNSTVSNTLSANSVTSDSLTTLIGAIQDKVTPTYSGYFKGYMPYIFAWKSVKQINTTDLPDLFEYFFSSGDGSQMIDRVTPATVSATMNGTLANIWATKQNVIHLNLQYGFDLWVNNSTSALRRIALKANGDSIRGSGDIISGYTWNRKCLPVSASSYPPAETLVRYTGLTDIDLYDIESDVRFNSSLFAKLTKDGNSRLTKVEKLLLYSSAITGGCLAKTTKYINA